jgi:hypothetical protein
MKKAVIASGMVFASTLFVLAFGLLVATPAPAVAQNTFSMTFNNLPTDNVALSTYIGLDRKLKAAPGQTLEISVIPPLTTPLEVRLFATVTAQSVVGVPECSGVVGSATTQIFTLTGSGRTLSTNDFSGSSLIGIASSSESQGCIDALADKIQKGVASLPAGIYQLSASLNDASAGTQLATATHTITISGSSTTEAVINLTSPSNDERVPQSPQVVFIFDTSIPGRLLCFEHSTLSQSPQDATRDLNSSLKCVDYAQNSRGTNQVTATYPGISTRPWMAGKKYSWLFLGSTSTGGGATETRSSPIWSFTVQSNDPNYNSLVMALSNAPDPIGSTYANMVNIGYALAFSSANPIRIQEGNGPLRPIDITQVLTLLGDLGRRNVRVNAQIVNE